GRRSRAAGRLASASAQTNLRRFGIGRNHSKRTFLYHPLTRSLFQETPMRRRLFNYLACASISAFVAGGAAQAESSTMDLSYTPVVGQAGKDVVWVPTPQELVDV